MAEEPKQSQNARKDAASLEQTQQQLTQTQRELEQARAELQKQQQQQQQRQKAAKPQAAMKVPDVGFNPVRPFQRMWQFASGTVTGALRGSSGWGSRGAMAGAVFGIFQGMAAIEAGVALSMIGTVGVGIIVGAFAGVAFGMVLGALTGGFNQASRGQQRDDAADRARARGQQQYQSRGDHIDMVNDSNFDRTLQQNQENDSYWRDHVTSQGQGQGRGY